MGRNDIAPENQPLIRSVRYGEIEYEINNTDDTIHAWGLGYKNEKYAPGDTMGKYLISKNPSDNKTERTPLKLWPSR
jgi:hypothetical protein